MEEIDIRRIVTEEITNALSFISVEGDSLTRYSRYLKGRGLKR